MDDNERREILNKAFAEINASLLSNSQMLDKALLSLSSAGLGVSLAFIKNVVSLKEATDLYLLYSSWGAFAGAILSTLISFLTSQHGLEKQAKQFDDELKNMDDNGFEGNYDETDRSDRYFQISKWLTRLSLVCYIAAIILTVLFVILNGDAIYTTISTTN